MNFYEEIKVQKGLARKSNAPPARIMPSRSLVSGCTDLSYWRIGAPP